MRSGIHLAKMQVCALNGFTCLYKTDHNITDVMTDFILLFYFETAGEQFFFQFVRGHVDIYIIFQPAKWY